MDDSNLYDAPPEEQQPNQDTEKPDGEGEQRGQLVNREVWPDAEPGAVKPFRCLKVMDKEIELMAEEGEEEQDKETTPMPTQAGGEGESMMG